MSNINALLYLSQAVCYVVRREKQTLVNNAIKDCMTFSGSSKHTMNRNTMNRNTMNRNIKAHNKRYTQNMNRRKHQIKQPGVDDQRKNIYRKGRN